MLYDDGNVALPVKMAACLPTEGDTADPDKRSSSSASQTLKQKTGGSQGGATTLGAPLAEIRPEDDKAYEEVARYDEENLRKFLEDVTSVGKKSTNNISPCALSLFRKEQDALREESSSDDGELAFRRHRHKKLIGRRDQSNTSDQSAAARASTGGSLGSLHDSGEPKPKEGHNQGVASRSREGGSCGNLSRGSFETQPPRKRKGRRSRDAARASTSQWEGGSLQNLSKTEATSNHPKNLHKSGSLSQVCSEVTGARNKNRRQKTASESSSCRYSRRSEDRDGGGESSGDETYHRSQISPNSTQSAVHPFPAEGVGGASGISTDWNNDGDSMSEDNSESTEDDNEEKEQPRSLGLGPGRNCSSEPIEEDGIELQEVTVHRTSTDVDRGINFSLSRSQEENMHGSCSRRTLPLQDSQCVNSVLREEKPSNKGSDDEGLGRRKTSRSESANSENKAALDENGNPIMGTSSSSSLMTSGNPERQKTTSGLRSNGLSAPHKEISRFDRLKAKIDKKKANKEKGVYIIQDTPDCCGKKDIHDILKHIGVPETETATKSRKKHKNREDEKVKKRSKHSDKPDEEKCKSEDTSSRLNDEMSLVGGETIKKTKEKEEEKKTSNNKKNKNETGKKKNSGSLRESSSVEDLVSKSKQSDNVRDIRKQVTVDDGDMGLDILHTYHSSKKVDQVNNFILDGKKYLNDADIMHNDSEGNITKTTSEFVADFYSVGDSYSNVSQAPSSPSGDFEIVSSKKRNKKSRSGSQTASQSSKSGGSDRWSGGSNSGSVYSDDNFRGNRVCPNKFSSRPSPGNEKPHINFAEGPRTMHENMFLARWGMGDRHGDRYVATTSAPHSEDSESDGDDSVHSMPAPSITPRPDVRKPPPSSGSTPQASYANIAKLAASANHAQMKRMSAASIQNTAVPVKELDKDSSVNETDLSDMKSGAVESRPTNILDDNFPSLTESLGGSSPPSVIFTSKSSEMRTNPLCDNAVIPPKIAVVQQIVDKSKDSVGNCDAKSGSQESVETVANAVSSQEGPAKSSICPTNPSPPQVSHAGHTQHLPSNQPYQFQHPPPPTQPHSARSHDQNHKSSHPNTQCGSSQSAPPSYYTHQRHNPFNRKDDDSPPNNRYPPPIRSPHPNHPNGALSYPPPMQTLPPHFKQPPPQQPVSHLPNPIVQQTPRSQQNSHTQSGSHSQRNNPNSQNPHASQAKHVQEKVNVQHNLNSQQYPPLQSPYTLQNSQVPKPSHMQQSTRSQKNIHNQTQFISHSQNNLNIQQNPPHKNAVHQQNNSLQPSPQVNSHIQQNQHIEPSSMQKSLSPADLVQSRPDPSSRPSPNSSHNPQSHTQKNHPAQQNACTELELQGQADQHFPHLIVNSNQPSSLMQSSPVPPRNLNLQNPQPATDSSRDVDIHHAISLPTSEHSEDRQFPDNKSLCKASDSSRLKKLEPAVVFTDNAKFDHSVSGLEFGFGFDESIVASHSVSENEDSVNSNDLKTVTKDFSKWFQAPKNDVISYNYEELIRHVSSEWDKTLRLMEGDPKNVQYWRASSSSEA